MVLGSKGFVFILFQKKTPLYGGPFCVIEGRWTLIKKANLYGNFARFACPPK